SGADTGVAGSLAINIGLSNAQETIADNATLTVGGGDVALTAQNRVENKVSAKASAGDNGSPGVGASIALNIGETDTDAIIGSGVTIAGPDASTHANNVTLSATSKSAMTTEAEGGAGGETAVTPIIAISIANNDTAAKLRGGVSGTTEVHGDISFNASHDGSVTTTAKGATQAGKTGVGISLGLTIVSDSAIATTERDLAADGRISFSARNTS